MSQRQSARSELTETSSLLPRQSSGGVWTAVPCSPSALLLLLLFLIPAIFYFRGRSDAPAILTHSQPKNVIASRHTNDTIHMLSLNTFIRPVLIGLHDYKDERLADMLPVFLTRDLLCLQELFWTTGNRKQVFLDSLSENYPYSAHAPKPRVWDWFRVPPKPIDAGLAILSARPIVATAYHMYTASAMLSVDWFVQKGVLHACVSVAGGVVHVFTTHMQAGPFPHVHERQLKELVTFVEKRAPRGEAVILAGDFNIDGRRGYNDSRDSAEYTKLVEIVGSVGLVDAMRQLGQVVTTAGGLWGKWQRNERIDYLFVRPGDMGLVAGNVGVDRLAVDGKEYLTMSDHYAVVADVEVVNGKDA